ncbi:SUMF1/EgtB/PvdO family nonheme iron enzyme, partial [Bacillus paralicheniformis]|uniref:SUMF1/EgtB/PvdO family nonheme iron enzyme n=1 Tax=Bacillus paralicheniformis TaxID=1648923 RepID=UPI002852C523
GWPHSRPGQAFWNLTGKELPSSQQWEKAACGIRGAVYPWGDQPTPAKCNVRENGVGSYNAGRSLPERCKPVRGLR